MLDSSCSCNFNESSHVLAPASSHRGCEAMREHMLSAELFQPYETALTRGLSSSKFLSTIGKDNYSVL